MTKAKAIVAPIAKTTILPLASHLFKTEVIPKMHEVQKISLCLCVFVVNAQHGPTTKTQRHKELNANGLAAAVSG